MNKQKYELYRGANRDWYWRFVAGNGEIVAQGEGYRRKIDAVKAIKLLQGSADAAVVVIKS